MGSDRHFAKAGSRQQGQYALDGQPVAEGQSFHDAGMPIAHRAVIVRVGADETVEQGANRELKEEVGKLRDVVYRIADRLEVPVIRRD